MKQDAFSSKKLKKKSSGYKAKEKGTHVPLCVKQARSCPVSYESRMYLLKEEKNFVRLF